MKFAGYDHHVIAEVPSLGTKMSENYIRIGL